ncbi:MAG: hypothetical protein VCD66_03120, partial [Alphaproteobacteria bacterium]
MAIATPAPAGLRARGRPMMRRYGGAYDLSHVTTPLINNPQLSGFQYSTNAKPPLSHAQHGQVTPGWQAQYPTLFI